MARPTYKSFVRKCGDPPKRETMNIGGDGPFFRDGKLNRDPHGSEGEESAKAERKEVHVYHHGKDEAR